MTRSKGSREKVAWDGVVKGLGLRRRGEAVSWILQVRIRGRSVKRVVGDGAMPRPEARAAARALIAELQVSLEGAPERLATVAEFGARYIADKSAGWAAETIKRNRSYFRTTIAPALGDLRIADVTRVDVITWLDGLTCSAGTRNICMAFLSGIMRHAELLEIRSPGSNPCKGLRRRKSAFKATYLTRDEFAAVGAAFRALENRFPGEVAVLRFAALTGCRKGEALGLKWDWLDGQRFALPTSKTGPRPIWLWKAALALVERQSRGSEFVFTSGGEAVSVPRLDLVWRQVRKRTGLPRLRIHDLRHSFASVAIGNGIGMRTVAGLLGHHDLNSTAGYAHLQEDALKASVSRVGAHMSSLLAIRDTTPKSFRPMRVIDGVVRDGPAKRGRKPKPKPLKVATPAKAKATSPLKLRKCGQWNGSGRRQPRRGRARRWTARSGSGRRRRLSGAFSGATPACQNSAPAKV